jgi:class 3 adenylate cyclase
MKPTTRKRRTRSSPRPLRAHALQAPTKHPTEDSGRDLLADIMVKAQRGTHSIPQKRPTRADNETFQMVVEGYERTLFLRSFADAGRAPVMSDVDVAVCFADLRGFTDYVHKLQMIGQDNRVQRFLSSYFTIYTRAILHRVWSFEPDGVDQEPSASHHELRRLLVPAFYKNLGDGMMVVWELHSASTMVIHGLATRYIVQIVNNIRRLFMRLTTQLGPVEIDSYSEHVRDLKMGFGLAKGHAWRLDFGQGNVDYAGSILNLAARLQGMARPEGLVAQLGFSESKFLELQSDGNGSCRSILAPKGLGSARVEVYASKEVELNSEVKAVPVRRQPIIKPARKRSKSHRS